MQLQAHSKVREQATLVVEAVSPVRRKRQRCDAVCLCMRISETRFRRVAVLANSLLTALHCTPATT